MKPPTFMVVAGEASGDALAAELVEALRREWTRRCAHGTADAQPLRTALAPRFFGAGGPRMAAAGVELAFDLTRHSVIGLSEAVRQALKFRRLLHQLLRLARERQPDALICVDFHGFNGRLAAAVRRLARRRRGMFNNWNPRIVQFVSPQVWASRPGRAFQMAETLDLLLTIFPFEPAWYAARVPELRVEFVGHPLVGRYAGEAVRPLEPGPRHLLLLPGSRADEVRRHLPLLLETARRIAAARPQSRFMAVAPEASLAEELRAGLAALGNAAVVQVGGISAALRGAELAISKTGTVLMECAFFGVPAVTFYKTSWPTYWVGRRIIQVKWLSMPNILADAPLFPEFVQAEATAENLSRAALALLNDPARQAVVRGQLAEVVRSLGPPGAPERAARLIADLLDGTLR
ncbi:MAG: lipid-A-disaccharide synthase [Limisphaerales bacterium]